LACPPCNIGPLSTPHYAANLARPAIHRLSDGSHVFAGQRAEGFYVDLGSIFDLLALRPIQELNVFAKAIGLTSMPGVNSTKFVNVHSIALQVPISRVTLPKRPVIGVWTTASRQRVGIRDAAGGDTTWSGPPTQVSRLGNPLVNEVIIPMGKKDFWNAQPPVHDKAGTVRADLEAILLTGIPSGIVPGFTNFTGAVQADMLRLNTSIPPAKHPNPLGVIAGDLAGFPNGRRVFDDVVTVELRAVAGATLPLVDPSFTPDAAVSAITDGLTDTSPGGPYLRHFPYLGVPYDGYHHPS
jgi:hypothetical protein